MVKLKNTFQSEAHKQKKKNIEIQKDVDALVEKTELLVTDADELKRTKSDLKVYKDKLELIEEEFDIDYEMAVTLRDTEDKLRSELAKSKKLLVAIDMKKEISDKLIKSIQLDNETLKNEIIV